MYWLNGPSANSHEFKRAFFIQNQKQNILSF